MGIEYTEDTCAQTSASKEAEIDATPLLSVVVPCRNEVSFVRDCIASIAQAEYPREKLEIIAVDGMSEDGTREALDDLTLTIPNLKVVPNPDRTTPHAFNRGIRASSGDVIAILNGHSVYPTDYLPRCVKTLVEMNADVVGGVMIPIARSQGIIAKAIARALSHPFGIGNAAYRTGARRPLPVDVVGYGCYRRSLFEQLGLYNERLTRSQDMDLNSRIRRAGGRILLEPSARYTYSARSGLVENWRYNFGNGRWVSLPIRLVGARFGLRHLVPAGFVATLLLCGVAAALGRTPRLALGAVGASYLTCAIAAAISAAVKDRDPYLVIGLPVAFTSLHVSYGLGTLWGFIEPLGRYTTLGPATAPVLAQR